MESEELFDRLGFRWDRVRAQAPVDIGTVQEAVAAFNRDMAGHVWAAAALEGNPFTYPEVKALLEGVTVGGRKVADADQILRLRDAYELLVDLVTSQEFILAKDVSDSLHDIIGRNEAPETGHFRGEGSLTSPVAVNLGELGTHLPPPTQAGGGNLRDLYETGLRTLNDIEHPFERACAYFLFAADNQFYFDGNKRTARSMMNGLLMSVGINAVLVPAQARQEFNQAMVDFHVGRDGTAIMDLFGSCGPRWEETLSRQRQLNEAVQRAQSPDVT